MTRFLLALTLLAALSTAACDDQPAEPPAPAPVIVPDLGARVAFAAITKTDTITKVSLPAEVVLPADAVKALAPPLPGRLVSWSLRLGDRVAAGAPLARVDSPQLTDLAAAERELAAVVRARRRVAAEQRRQMTAGLTTAQDVQALELSLRESQARLTAIREQLEARRAMGARDTEEEGSSWIWRAPAAGVVQSIDCAAGVVASPEQACLTLLDLTRAELVVRVPERFIGDVGEDVRVAFTAASRPDVSHVLTLTRRDPTLDARSRTLAHYFVPPEGDAAAAAVLLPGASGRVELFGEAPADVHAVPAEAVTRFEGSDVVFVAAGERPADAIPAPVTVVGRHEGKMLVRGDLAADARIAVRGVFLLKSLRALGEE